MLGFGEELSSRDGAERERRAVKAGVWSSSDVWVFVSTDCLSRSLENDASSWAWSVWSHRGELAGVFWCEGEEAETSHGASSVISWRVHKVGDVVLVSNRHKDELSSALAPHRMGSDSPIAWHRASTWHISLACSVLNLRFSSCSLATASTTGDT